MKRVLVTGGAGFIGSHLVPALARRGWEVRVLDSLSPQIHGPSPAKPIWKTDRPVEFLRGSVTSREDLSQALADVDAVVHLAAETGTGQSMYEIARYNLVNTQGAALLLDVLANDASHTVRRIALASSRSVYGEGTYVCEACSPSVRVCPLPRQATALASHLWQPLCPTCGAELTAVPTHEDDPVRPASIYAATKLAQEDLLRIACESLGIGHGILRLQNVYGEGQSLNNPYTGILSIFSTRIRRGLELPIFEDGQETRDFVHVSDVAAAFAGLLDAPEAPGRVINVGSGVGTPVIEVARALSRAFGSPERVRVTGEYRLGDIRHNVADVARLHALLDLSPQVTLPDGLERFVAWVDEQPLPEDRLALANAELRRRGMMG